MARSDITLELIAHGQRTYQILPIASYVQKYIEEFVYLDKIKDSSVPVSYFESKPIDSWKNIQLINKTYVLPSNETNFISADNTWTEIAGRSYTSRYKEVALTTETFIENSGRKKPLFFKHILPENTKEAKLEIVTRGNKVKIDDGFVFDIENDVIYTNYKNYFDPDTGAYRIFFIVSSDVNGKATHELLSPVEATKEASWEDIILTGEDAGSLTEAYPVYNREKNSDGYTFYLNRNSTWYAKPLENSTIKPMLPSSRDPEDAWHLSFTNGDFTTNVNGSTKRYYVPEYDTQPFAPYKPYIYAPYKRLLYVNENILAATKTNLAIMPENSRHITIFAYDEDGLLKSAYTTDQSLHGKRAFKKEENEKVVNKTLKDIFYEADKISAYDNQGGFILLNTRLNSQDTYYASFSYEAKSLEYTELNLNPLSNKSALDHIYVFYIHPNANSYDKAIHYLKINRSGEIVFCSQRQGRAHPNLQALNEDGTPNTNSIIGMKYTSLTEDNSFIKKYCVPYMNEYAYYVLCEVAVLETEQEEDAFIVDVRRDGGVIKQELFEKAIRANNKILQSKLGYGTEGQQVPVNGVLVINAPITLLEEYGGPFTKEEAEKFLKTYTNQSEYTIIDWVYEKAEISGWSQTTGTATLTVTWEGPDLTYKFYRKDTAVGEWELIHSIENPPEGNIEYTDLGLTSNKRYYYQVRILKDEVLHPGSNKLSLMVR
jgi:hypothetical protein